MNYTAWENGRLVRRRMPVIGEYAIGASLGFTLTLMGALVVLLVFGCGDAPLGSLDGIEEAQAAWGVVEMCPVRLHEVSQRALDVIAKDHGAPEGSTIQGYTDIPGCDITILQGLPDERRAKVVIHEIGHLLRGEPGHILCNLPGDNIMCPDGGGPLVTEPTEYDRIFVGQRQTTIFPLN